MLKKEEKEIGIYDSRYSEVNCDIENTPFSMLSTKIDERRSLLPDLWMLSLISTSLPYLTHRYSMIPIYQHVSVVFWESRLWFNSPPCIHISITKPRAFLPPVFSYPTFSQRRISVESMLIGSNSLFFFLIQKKIKILKIISLPFKKSSKIARVA